MRNVLHADSAAHHDGMDSAADRLKDALARLTRANSDSGHTNNATVAKLCRLAGISRNSLYRYHTPVLETLRRHQRKRAGTKMKQPSVIDGLRKENATLRDRVGKLATLVDHYFCAYRETQVLLQRSERQLAELRRSLGTKPRVSSADLPVQLGQGEVSKRIVDDLESCSLTLCQ
jgi:hypothetical protein